MNTRQLASSALASAVALGLVTYAADAAAQEKPKVACYGIAKKGQNDCGNLAGTHSCAGQAKVDFDPSEWRYVPKGTCKNLKGMTAEEAKAARDGKASTKADAPYVPATPAKPGG